MEIRRAEKKAILKHIEDGKKRFEFDERNYPKYQFLDQKIAELKRLKKFDAIFE